MNRSLLQIIAPKTCQIVGPFGEHTPSVVYDFRPPVVCVPLGPRHTLAVVLSQRKETVKIFLHFLDANQLFTTSFTTSSLRALNQYLQESALPFTSHSLASSSSSFPGEGDVQWRLDALSMLWSLSAILRAVP